MGIAPETKDVRVAADDPSNEAPRPTVNGYREYKGMSASEYEEDRNTQRKEWIINTAAAWGLCAVLGIECITKNPTELVSDAIHRCRQRHEHSTGWASSVRPKATRAFWAEPTSSLVSWAVLSSSLVYWSIASCITMVVLAPEKFALHSAFKRMLCSLLRVFMAYIYFYVAPIDGFDCVNRLYIYVLVNCIHHGILATIHMYDTCMIAWLRK